MPTTLIAADKVIRKTPRTTVKEYLGYWVGLVPRTHEEYYRFWLFSYMSVRQRWEDNVRGFETLKALPRPFTAEQAKQALETKRLGIFNNRSKWISSFSQLYWKDPEAWYPQAGEPMRNCRSRLSHKVKGLGRAKVSFVLEMLCPAASEVVCLDSHMLKLYGHSPTAHVTDTVYFHMEDHWLGLCKHLRKPSPMVRHIYWDRLRQKENTRYWSYVLEPA